MNTPQTLTAPYEIPNPYARFGALHRAAMTAIMGMGILTVAIGMAAYLSALPKIAADFNTSQEIINDCLAGFNIMCGLSPLILSPLASYYGRRFGLMICSILFCAGSVGVSLSQTLPALAGTLLLQAAGTIPAWSFGAAIIGDLYPPETRGRGVAFFYVLGTCGNAIAPALTGLFTEYTSTSWRGMLYFLASMSLVVLVLQLLFVPDTAHIYTPFARSRWLLSNHTFDDNGNVTCTKLAPFNAKLIVKTWNWQAINPWVCIRTLKNPMLLMIAIYSSVIQYGAYTLTVPLSVTLAPRYNITNAALIGVLFLPIGLGDFLGGLISGWIADKTLIHYAKKRNPDAGRNDIENTSTSPTELATQPEDRLRTVWIGGLILLPGSLIGSGWLMETGAGGIAPLIILLVIQGAGVILPLVGSNTFMLDIAESQKAEAMSAALCLRMLFTAGASASILPLIEATSIGKANTIAAGITIAAYSLIIATIYLAKRERTKKGSLTGTSPEASGQDNQTAAGIFEEKHLPGASLPSSQTSSNTMVANKYDKGHAIKDGALPAMAGV